MLRDKEAGLDILQIEGPKCMPTANRQRWMRAYMAEYRQGKVRGDVTERYPPPDRHEELKEAHRLDSFKSRLSKLLSPQYEILLCVQYAPEYGVFLDDDGLVKGCEQRLCNESRVVMYRYPPLRENFKFICDVGGGEIFKGFLLMKYSRKFDRVTECVVGVLDKAALLENLQKLSRQNNSKWEKVLNKVKMESSQGSWRKLIFSESWLYLDRHTACFLLKCTTRDHPQWNSSALHRCLYQWALGSRTIGLEEKYEWPTANVGYTRRLILSPLLM